MACEVQCFEAGEIGAFLAIAESFLYAKADEHCQMLGPVIGVQQPQPLPAFEGSVFAVAYETTDGEEKTTLAVAVWRPGRITVSAGPEAAIRQLATKLMERGGLEMSALKGAMEAVNWFSDEVLLQFRSSQGKNLRVDVTEEALLYRCDTVTEVSADGVASSAGGVNLKLPDGELRAGASPGDLHRLCDIIDEEQGSKVERERWEKQLADPVFAEKFFFWVRGDTLVAKAKYMEWTPACAGVQGVFTPGDARGQGYATGLMHGMCKTLLEKYEFLVLYVAKENGAANRVYQKIGFKEVTDSKMVRFVNQDTGV
eukprot:TRINITY_DN45466_c0_g1_i2.p1 TRINITY_DN45466_c0_g1~~TRINITY_DN45466_c0_g1_i2.p1  ORF type:complete len:313 (+),score=55.53 TRINITY_DN45466_c0_g1_i2:66-1004(+)